MRGPLGPARTRRALPLRAAQRAGARRTRQRDAVPCPVARRRARAGRVPPADRTHPPAPRTPRRRRARRSPATISTDPTGARARRSSAERIQLHALAVRTRSPRRAPSRDPRARSGRFPLGPPERAARVKARAAWRRRNRGRPPRTQRTHPPGCPASTVGSKRTNEPISTAATSVAAITQCRPAGTRRTGRVGSDTTTVSPSRGWNTPSCQSQPASSSRASAGKTRQAPLERAAHELRRAGPPARLRAQQRAHQAREPARRAAAPAAARGWIAPALDALEQASPSRPRPARGRAARPRAARRAPRRARTDRRARRRARRAAARARCTAACRSWRPGA